MRKHPEYGRAILRAIPGLERASLLVLLHHEGFDGSGYPAGLAGEEILLGARIVAVVDAFDAMLSSRSYREGPPLAEALRRLRASAGAQFDPRIVDQFLRLAAKLLPEVSTIDEFASETPSFRVQLMPLLSAQGYRF